MELNDLRIDWYKVGDASRDVIELQRMTRITNHPSLKRLRFKLIAETIGLTLFLLVYYDWFDGDKKPFIVNLLLVVSISLYILNDVIGYASIRNPIQGINVRLSIQKYLDRVRRLFVLSTVVSLVYSVSIMIFFTSVISFNKEKKLIMAGMMLILFQMMILSIKTWNKRINKLEQQVKDFDQDDEHSNRF